MGRHGGGWQVFTGNARVVAQGMDAPISDPDPHKEL